MNIVSKYVDNVGIAIMVESIINRMVNYGDAITLDNSFVSKSFSSNLDKLKRVEDAITNFRIRKKSKTTLYTIGHSEVDTIIIKNAYCCCCSNMINTCEECSFVTVSGKDIRTIIISDSEIADLLGKSLNDYMEDD